MQDKKPPSSLVTTTAKDRHSCKAREEQWNKAWQQHKTFPPPAPQTPQCSGGKIRQTNSA